MAIHLRIEDAASGASPREATYTQQEITIGREPFNVVRLTDPSHMVSRRHAAIRQEESAALIDLGSRNGSYLNDLRLEPQRTYPLSDGDVICIGPYRIEFGEVDDEPEPASTDVFLTQFLSPSEAKEYELPRKGASREELHRAVEELKILHEMALSLGSTFDTDELLDRLVRRSVELIGAEEGLVSLLDEAVGEDERVIHTMIRTGQAFRLNAYLREWMVRHMEPLLLNDPAQHPDFNRVRWESSLRNLITVPLTVRDELIGLLTIYNKHGEHGFTPSDVRLMSIIGSQSSQIIHNVRLLEEQQKLMRMEEQLAIALDIQRNLLPKAPPQIVGYDVAGESIAAHTVGGDHFDYIEMANGRYAFALGDVSGKGLPAALVMANLQATLRAQTMWSPTVSACIESTNLLLHRSTNRRTFVTLFYGVIDTNTHQLTYANAGHNRPYLCKGSTISELQGAGFLLGGIAGTTYNEYVRDFERGTALVIFSDGVVEARRADGALYGEERLVKLLAEHGGSSAEAIVDVVLADVAKFAAGEPQSDDITVLVIRRR